MCNLNDTLCVKSLYVRKQTPPGYPRLSGPDFFELANKLGAHLRGAKQVL